MTAAVMCYRMVLEMLDHSMVVAAGDSIDGYSDTDGCLVGVCVLHQNSCSLTVCHLSQCSNYSLL